jgi:NADH-quinone oxidoreductase subunit A
VALLFIIFDVEVALFFPWATVFGKATQLADPSLQTVQADGASLTPAAAGLLRELGIERPAVPDFSGAVIPAPERVQRERAAAERDVARAGGLLARIAVADMATFFAILLVGFAYVWNRGDLDWVRATSNERGSRG